MDELTLPDLLGNEGWSVEKRAEFKRVQLVIGRIEEANADVTGNFGDDWAILAKCLASFGDFGKPLFMVLSRLNSAFDEKKVNEQYEIALKKPFKSCAKLFTVARECGVDTKFSTKVKEGKTEVEDVLPEGANIADYKEFGFWEQNGAYYSIGLKGQVVQVSNFFIRILFHVQTGAEEAYRIIEIKNVYGHSAVINLNTDDFVSVGSFKKVVARRGNYIFKGNDVDLCRLQDKLQREERPTKMVEVLGYNRQANAYFFANGMYDCGEKDEFTGVDEYGILNHEGMNYFIPANSKIYANKDDQFVNDKKFIFQHQEGIDFASWAEKFVGVYGKRGWMGIIFYVACIFRDIIHKGTNNRFPIMNMYGPRGSGKGTMIESLMHLFGKPQDQLMLGGASTTVGFMRKFAQYFNAVVWLDEYKNNLRPQFIESLKNIYDGIGYERGKKDHSFQTQTTPIHSGCILSGQEMPTIEPALFTRVILLAFEELHLDAKKRAEFASLKNVEQKGLSFITVGLLRLRAKFQEKYKDQYQKEYNSIAAELDNDDVMERIKSNYAVMNAVCSILLESENMPFTLDEFRKYSMDLLMKQHFILSGSDDSSKFWEMVQTLFVNGTIKEGKDFMLSDGYLFIRIQNIYGEYAKELRQRGDPNVLAKPTLENYLESDRRTFVGRMKKQFTDMSYAWTWKFKYKELGLDMIRGEDFAVKTKMAEMGVEVGLQDQVEEKVGEPF